jgi:hypothetical protein
LLQAVKLNIVQLTEDGLLDLIREMSGEEIELEVSQDSVISATPTKNTKTRDRTVVDNKESVSSKKIKLEIPPDQFYKSCKEVGSEDTQPSSGIGSSLPSSPVVESKKCKSIRLLDCSQDIYY